MYYKIAEVVFSRVIKRRNIKKSNRAFQPAAMPIYWNKRTFLHKEKFNPHRVGVRRQHGRRFIVCDTNIHGHFHIDHIAPCLPQHFA